MTTPLDLPCVRNLDDYFHRDLTSVIVVDTVTCRPDFQMVHRTRDRVHYPETCI